MFRSRDGNPLAENPFFLGSYGLLRWDFVPKYSYAAVAKSWLCLKTGRC